MLRTLIGLLLVPLLFLCGLPVEAVAVRARQPSPLAGCEPASNGTFRLAFHPNESRDSPLGLYYLRARYLNAASGRFWSMDSYAGRGSDPASLHKYLFCEGDPANCTDPSGMFSLSEVMLTVAVKVTVFALQHPRIVFGVQLLFTVANLTAFIADEQFRDEMIGTFGPTTMGRILAYDARFLYNTGANVLSGTFSIATEAARQGFRIVYRDPQEIKYLQEGISPQFRNNRGSVTKLIEGLRSGAVQSNEVEPIRVFKGTDGRTFTLDHRRLYAYKQARVKIPTVEVAPESVADDILRKTDLGADGESIIVRGD